MGNLYGNKNKYEIPSTTSSQYSNSISQQLYKLRKINNHLKNAFNGNDVEWSDEGKNCIGLIF